MKFKSFVIVFLLLTYSLFPQDNLLDRANSAFNNNDYSNARELYLQILHKGKFSGETLYRYTYSLEMLNDINSEIMNLYVASWWYLSMDGSNEQYLTNSKNKLEEKIFNISPVTWGNAQEIVRKHLQENKAVKPPTNIKPILTVLIILAILAGFIFLLKRFGGENTLTKIIITIIAIPLNLLIGWFLTPFVNMDVPTWLSTKFGFNTKICRYCGRKFNSVSYFCKKNPNGKHHRE